MGEMVLRLPSIYVGIESDEMEYIDGGIFGFQPSNFAKSYANLANIFIAHFGSRAFGFAGGWIAVGATWTYWTAVSTVGAQAAALVTAAASVVGGPVGMALGAAAALGGVGALIIYMGSGVRFS